MASREADVVVIRRLKQVDTGQGDQAAVRAKLIAAIAETMASRQLSQVQAAKLCRTDQPTLSKLLRGRTKSVTLDRLVGWLLVLGRSVEIRVARAGSGETGRLKAVVDG